MSTNKTVLAAVCLACAGLTAPRAAAEQINADGRTEDLIRSAATWAGRFERSLDQSLGSSSYSGSRLENRLRDWAKYMREEVKHAADKYDKSGPFVIGPRTHMENALTVAEGINRAMLAERFPNIVESDWVRVRNGLNQLATNFTLAPISTTRVGYAPTRRERVMTPSQTQILLEDIHQSTRRFKRRFDDAVGRYTAMTDRTKFARDTANALQDSTGRLVKDFEDNKPRSFRQDLQDTFVVAAAMNRIMVEDQLSGNLKAQWSDIRNDLNRVARVYGQPLLPERFSPLYQPYQPLTTD